MTFSAGSIAVALEATGGNKFSSAMASAAGESKELGTVLSQLVSTVDTMAQAMTRMANAAAAALPAAHQGFENLAGSVNTLSADMVGLQGATGTAGHGIKGAGKAAWGLAEGIQAAAGAAAAYAAVGKAMDMAKQAQETEAATKTFRALGGNIDDLRKATGGMISDAELVKKANLAETMGIPADAFQTLAQVAQASAAKTGQSMDFLFDSIVTGTARQSKMILDNLGIMLNQERAERNMAAARGKTVDQLSEAEKKQAFLNEVMAQGAVITKQVADAGVSLSNPFGKFTASLSNAQDAMGSLLKNGFEVFFKVVTPALDMVVKFKDGVERLAPWVKTLLGSFLALVGGVVAATAALAAGGQAWAFLGTTLQAAKVALFAVGKATLAAAAPMLMWGFILAGIAAGVAVLHKVWRENWGGIQDKTHAVLTTVQDWASSAGKNILAAFYYLKDGALWALGKIAELGISALLAPVRAVVGAVELLMAAFSKMFAMAGKAAKALGQTNLGRTFEQAATDMDRAVAGIGASLDDVQGKMAFAVQVEAPTWEGAQAQAAEGTQALKGLAGGVGGAIAEGATTLWDALKTAGVFVAEEWKLMLSGVSLFSEEGVNRVRKGGAEAGKEMSAALIKARESWRDMLHGMSSRLETLGMEGPQKGIREATLENEQRLAELAEKARAAAISADAYNKAVGMSGRIMAQQQAEAVSGSKTLAEFADALAFAKAESLRTGKAFDETTVRLGKLDTAGLLSGPVQDAGDNIAKAFNIQLGPQERGDVTKTISENLANLIKGGRLNWEQIGSTLGQLITTQAPALGKALGGVAGKLGTLVGGAAGTLGPVGAAVGAALVQAVQTVGPILEEAARTVAEGIRTVFEEVPKAISDAAGKLASFIPEDRIQAAVAAAFNPAVIQAFWVPAVSAVAASLMGLALMGDIAGKALFTLVTFGPMLAAPVLMVATSMAATIGPLAALGVHLAAASVAALGFGFAVAGVTLAFLKLSTETKSFKAFGDAMRASVDRVVKALDPFWVHMSALAGLFDAFIDVVLPLAASFAATDVAAKALFYTLKGAAIGLAAGVFAIGVFVKVLAVGAEGAAMAFSAIGNVLERVIGGFNAFQAAVLRAGQAMIVAIGNTFGKILPAEMNATLASMALALSAEADRAARKAVPNLSGPFDELAEQARAMSPDLDAMAQAIRDLTGLSYEEAVARAKALQAQREATESLTNVPAGYKVALARFEAMDATGAGGAGGSASDLLNTVIGRLPGGAGAQGAGGGSSAPGAVVNETSGWGVWQPPTVLGKAQDGQPGSTTIVMENVTVVANNPQELMESLEAQTKRSAFIRTGSSNARPFRPFNGAGI